MTDVTVVGSGPNGLAAAVVAARAGLDVLLIERADTIGGGTRSAELTLPGFVHDVCSAVHPTALASPFFRDFKLAERIQWAIPDASYAHPLDGRPAAMAWRDLDRTAEELGRDGPAWRRLLQPLVDHIGGVVDFTGHQLLRMPKHPLTALRYGLSTLEQGTPLAGIRFREFAAPALFAGVAAHAAGRHRSLATAGAALLLAAHGHAGGWPVPVGGSQAIADALLADFVAHGGRVQTGRHVSGLAELQPSKVVLLDTAPELLFTADLPRTYERALRRYRYGSGVAKVDFALDGPVPWLDPAVGLAPTVHLGGSAEEIRRSENIVFRGGMPDNPYVLVTQPSVIDSTRAPAGQQVLWAYTHVPADSTLDATELVTAQVERFAPGFRDVVLASHATSARGEEELNPNYIGGDIYSGAVTLTQLVKRPVVSPTPWRTPIPGVYLCSSATPPGPAVHGMNGWFAVRLALRDHFGIRLRLGR